MRFTGERSHCKTFYFEPDEDAPRGRYFDGAPISEHPSELEIKAHWEFWTALASEEQKEVLQGYNDMGLASKFIEMVKGKDDYTIVSEAIAFWDKFYPHEVKAFMDYIRSRDNTLLNPQGWDKSKQTQLKGSVPQRVKQLVMGVKPELCRYYGKDETLFQKIFYQIFTKALVGGTK